MAKVAKAGGMKVTFGSKKKGKKLKHPNKHKSTKPYVGQGR